MLATLLPLTFGLLWRWQSKVRRDYRTSFLVAATIWGVGLLVLTEGLSYFQEITKGWLSAGWIVFAVAAAILLWRVRKRREEAVDTACEPLSGGERALLCGIAVILLVTGVLAVTSPPNTDDVMEYHLPRVMLWASNRSVQFFPAFDYSQLIHAPWAEYVALHFYVLSGSDRWNNLIEWFAFLGCILGASLIAQKLGAHRQGQILAAVFCATLPALILEASGSNNTAVGAFWIAAAIVFLLDEPNTLGRWKAFLVGAACGLALLAKGTAVIFLPILLAAVFLVKRPRFQASLVERIAAGSIVFVLLNLPQFVRNERLTGSVLGLPFPEAGNRLSFRDEILGPSVAASGIIRNVALHLGTPVRRVNYAVEQVLRRLIRIGGADPDDPRTTWREAFKVPAMTGREYFQGNPVQFLLICSVALWAILRRREAPPGAAILLLGVALAFCAFSAAMKWNLSGARYHLPLFVIGAALLGVCLPRMGGVRIPLGIAFVALATTAPFLAGNSLRSLVPGNRNYVFGNARESLYFADDAHAWQERAYREAADEVVQSGCREIGIDATLQTYVYPVMALIAERRPEARFQYVGVRNVTGEYAGRLHRVAPCIAICLGCMRVKSKKVEYQQPNSEPFLYGDIDVFYPVAQELEARRDRLVPQSQVVLQMEMDYKSLQNTPVDALFADIAAKTPQWKEDWRWQSRCDSLREMQLRWVAIWEWTGPLRRRASEGRASDADLDALTSVSEALPQLHEMFDQQVARLEWSVAHGTAAELQTRN